MKPSLQNEVDGQHAMVQADSMASIERHLLYLRKKYIIVGDKLQTSVVQLNKLESHYSKLLQILANLDAVDCTSLNYTMKFN